MPVEMSHNGLPVHHKAERKAQLFCRLATQQHAVQKNFKIVHHGAHRYKDHRPYPKDFATPKVADRFYTLVNPNQDVYKATYVFLPIVVKDGIPMIEWKDEWKLENYE